MYDDKSDVDQAIVLKELRGFDKEFIVEEFLTISEELTCSICLNLLNDPISCQSCDNMFCSNCIKIWNKVSSTCPNMCIFKPKPILHSIANLLGKIKMKCLYYKKGCLSIVNYKEMQSHLEQCEFSIWKCECGLSCFKKEYFDHLKNNCNKVRKLSFCKFCRENTTNNKQHYFTCKERSDVCKFCKMSVSVLDYSNHLVTQCEGLEFMCNLCKKFTFKLINKEETVYSVKNGKYN